MKGKTINSITLLDINDNTKKLVTRNHVIGLFHLQQDGFWYYSSSKNGGLYSEYSLKYVLDILKSINAEAHELYNKLLKDESKE